MGQTDVLHQLHERREVSFQAAGNEAGFSASLVRRSAARQSPRAPTLEGRCISCGSFGNIVSPAMSLVGWHQGASRELRAADERPTRPRFEGPEVVGVNHMKITVIELRSQPCSIPCCVPSLIGMPPAFKQSPCSASVIGLATQ